MFCIISNCISINVDASEIDYRSKGGDVTEDGTIDIMDVLRLAKLIAGWDVQTDELALDVTGDGNTDIMDVLRLAKYLAGWSVDVFYDGKQQVTACEDWVSPNNWEYIYSNIDKYSIKQAMSEVSTGIENMETQIYVSSSIPYEDVDYFVNFIFPMLSIKYCYVNVDKSAFTLNSDGSINYLRVAYYVNSKSAAEKMVKELDDQVAKVLSNITDSMSDYGKILYIHDWLICHATPDLNNYTGGIGGEWASSTYGAIVDGEPTCLGYAKALFYMLGEAGFDCTFVVGKGTNARHIWVKVKCDGDWYNIDPTWNDPCGSTQDADPNYVCYDYFMVPDSFIERTRAAVYEMKYFDDPTCTEMKYNWHVMNCAYIKNLADAEEILINQLTLAAASGADIAYARIKFDNENDYINFKSTHGSANVRNQILPEITSDYELEKLVPSSKCWTLCYKLVKKT